MPYKYDIYRFLNLCLSNTFDTFSTDYRKPKHGLSKTFFPFLTDYRKPFSVFLL